MDSDNLNVKTREKKNRSGKASGAERICGYARSHPKKYPMNRTCPMLTSDIEYDSFAYLLSTL